MYYNSEIILWSSYHAELSRLTVLQLWSHTIDFLPLWTLQVDCFTTLKSYYWLTTTLKSPGWQFYNTEVILLTSYHSELSRLTVLQIRSHTIDFLPLWTLQVDCFTTLKSYYWLPTTLNSPGWLFYNTEVILLTSYHSELSRLTVLQLWSHTIDFLPLLNLQVDCFTTPKSYYWLPDSTSAHADLNTHWLGLLPP
jgi:hypothetical protein